MEVRDNRGRKIGTVGPAYYPGTNCIVTLALIAVLIVGIVVGIGYIFGKFQAAASLPVHNSLRNIQVQGGNAGVSSNNAGLRITNGDWTYSEAKYSGVDVTVTAKLTQFTPGGSGKYCLNVRGDVIHLCILTTEHTFSDDQKTDTNAAVHTGIGGTNTLEIKENANSHGDFTLLVNGVVVDTEDFRLDSEDGTVGLSAGGDTNASTVTAIFTDLTIDWDRG